jgi:hypothetical protein
MAWLEHFSKFVNPTQEEQLLLIIDNHGSRKTMNAFNLSGQMDYCLDYPSSYIT